MNLLAYAKKYLFGQVGIDQIAGTNRSSTDY